SFRSSYLFTKFYIKNSIFHIIKLISEPIVEMEGSSQFDGRSMPKLTYLLVNQIRRSIRRKHTLPNYKIRFKPFFEILYNQKLYKADLADFLDKKKTSASKFGECAEYSSLCERLGVDLSSVGKLQINLKSCDRLPEALYSLNQAQSPKVDTQLIQKTASSLHLNLLSGMPAEKEQSFVYLTTSIDSHSMEQLMDKRTSREHWPFIEFEIQKTNANQMIGINFMEVFFINKTEICIQKISPDSLACKIKTIKKFDILYSINQVRCTSIKTLNKLIQKSAFQPIKFVVQRPIVVSKKPMVKMSNFPMRLSSVMDEEANESDHKVLNENFAINTSASGLVDFYCSVSECAMDFQINLLS
ncbi:PDZ domain-containing 8, partial [Brachionus plicatilis]